MSTLRYFLCALVTSACQWPPPLNPPPDATDAAPQTVDAGRTEAAPAPVPTDACAAAERRLGELGGCHLSPAFTADACRRALLDGRNWRPDCLARLASCDGLDAAYRAKGACP